MTVCGRSFIWYCLPMMLGSPRFLLLPKVVAEQQDGRRAGLLVFGAEGAAEERVDAEEMEESGRDDAGADAVRLRCRRAG